MEFIFDFIYNPKLETLKKIVRSIRKENKHINYWLNNRPSGSY